MSEVVRSECAGGGLRSRPLCSHQAVTNWSSRAQLILVISHSTSHIPYSHSLTVSDRGVSYHIVVVSAV